MKITVTKNEDRKLKAVIGGDEKGFFIRDTDTTVVYIGASGQIVDRYETKLEDFLDESVGLTPVYEGDTLNITF